MRGDTMRWHCILFNLSILAILILVLVSPAAARGNITPGIYPGTVKDVCVGDIVFVGETGLNLTPLTPYANGTVQELRSYTSDDPSKHVQESISVAQTTNFNVGSVQHYGIYYPVVNGQVLQGYSIQIRPFIPGYPQNVVITSSKDWIVANGADSALLTIAVTDGGNNPVSGADLVLSASAPWQLQDSALKTDGSGKAQTLFLPTTKGGTAVIAASASVQGLTVTSVTATQFQNIDAGPSTPYSMKPVYPGTATVGSSITIAVQVTDKYKNPVTSRRVPTNVTFLTTTNGTGAFLDEMGNRLKGISVPLNETGWAAATFQTATQEGDNYVGIIPPAPLLSLLIDVMGIGDSIPFSIAQSVSPAGNPPFVPADKNSRATIDYYLFDQWGNPSANQGIQIVTSVGENKIFYTNGEGRASILYGPKVTAGYYSLTATAVENSSVSISQTLRFGSMDPTDMLLTASPQTMASLDVNPNMAAGVIAKVIDPNGNPVKGQNVTFRIENSDNATFVETQPPAIGSGGINTTVVGDPKQATTDENGQAILDYYPGAFPKPKEPGYNQTATGTTTISASWEGPNGTVIRSVNLTYKNYPFISVYTEVNPRTVKVGDLVDVSVRLKGDGWALQPKPIDVILCTDRSTSMLYNESIVGGILAPDESPNDRMVDAMNAADTFVDQTNPDRDRIGVISFGSPANQGVARLFNASSTSITTLYLGAEKNAWRAGRDYNCKVGHQCDDSKDRDNLTDKSAFIMNTYLGHGLTGRVYASNPSDPSTAWVHVESPLTNNKTSLKQAIHSIVPAGGTPTRQAIYDSVNQIINDKGVPQDAVKAIILLTDGAWTAPGDPEGIITSPLSVKSYSGVPSGPGGDGTGSVIDYANNSGVKIYTIGLFGQDSDTPNAAALQRYADKTGGTYHRASDSTQLSQIYTEIAGQLKEQASVNTTVALDLSALEVSNHTSPLAGDRVFNYTYQQMHSTLVDTGNNTIPHFNGYPVTFDNTTDWNNGQKFNFSAGTIQLNQTWMVNFTLMTLAEGNIRIFNATTSKVTFEGVGGEVGIPDTYVTAISSGTEKGPEGIYCSINNLRRTNPISEMQIAWLAWSREYNGHDSRNITYSVWLSSYSNAFGEKDSFDKGAGVDSIDYPLIISDLQPGTYTVKVRGNPDAGDARDCWSDPYQLTIPGPTVTPQILIQ
jgi:hypothetical protein